jgi:hypothetical protein
MNVNIMLGGAKATLDERGGPWKSRGMNKDGIGRPNHFKNIQKGGETKTG